MKSSMPSRKEVRTDKYELVNTNWTEYGNWKGNKIKLGTVIDVTAEDFKNPVLANHLKLYFKRLATASVVSEPIKTIKKEIKE